MKNVTCFGGVKKSLAGIGWIKTLTLLKYVQVQYSYL
jgi:hypothetical protein